VRWAGEHHDLRALALDVRSVEFAAEFQSGDALPSITWGKRGPSRTRSSLRLGSYCPDTRMVRVHPVLDQALVPRWFVRYVVFHELLHCVHPPQRVDGDRWIHHGPEFRRREKRYPDFERARAWEEAHITALIRSARRGTSFTPAPVMKPAKQTINPAKPAINTAKPTVNAAKTALNPAHKPASKPARARPKPFAGARELLQRLLFPT
jgi:hypothetical protein